MTRERPRIPRASDARVAGLEIAVMFMGSTLLTPLYVIYQRAFGFTEITLTLVYAVYVVGNLGALFFFGRLSDQIGRRRANLPAILLGAVATLLFLGAASTPWLFLARMLSGLAIGIASAAATAWVSELVSDQPRASVLASTANLAGIAIGPLLAGLLAQYAPAPLRTTFVVYLMLLVFVAWRVTCLPETVPEPIARLRDVSFRPRFGVPRTIRRTFVAPALAAFATFALGGYYAALAPTLLADDLGITNSALAGTIVAEFFAVAALAVPATRTVQSYRAMQAGLVLLLPSVGLLLLAQIQASITALFIGSAAGGIALALGYRGTLQVVNAMAPADQRAEVIASYMIVCFLGNSLPVIGVGVLSRIAGHSIAHVAFAITIAVLAVTAAAARFRDGKTQAQPG
jgi:hypothetical protein